MVTFPFHHRRPDNTGVQPRPPPKNWSGGRPILAMEVGYSQLQAKTDCDAKYLISELDGKVKICLATTF